MRVWNVLKNDLVRTVCSKSFAAAALGLTAAGLVLVSSIVVPPCALDHWRHTDQYMPRGPRYVPKEGEGQDFFPAGLTEKNGCAMLKGQTESMPPPLHRVERGVRLNPSRRSWKGWVQAFF